MDNVQGGVLVNVQEWVYLSLFRGQMITTAVVINSHHGGNNFHRGGNNYHRGGNRLEEAIRPTAGWIGGSRSAICPAAGRIGGSRSAIRPAAGRTREAVMLYICPAAGRVKVK